MRPLGYTAQRSEGYINLLDYNARYYSAHLGRFISADSIIPNPAKAVSFDRFSYVDANPLKHRDPSGHIADSGCQNAGIGGDACDISYEDYLKWYYGITFDVSTHGEIWTEDEIRAVFAAVRAVGTAFAREMEGNVTAYDAFKAIYGNIVIEKNYQCSGCKDAEGNISGAWTDNAHHIVVASNFPLFKPDAPNRSYSDALVLYRNMFVHEFGHAFADLWYRADGSYDNAGPYGGIFPMICWTMMAFILHQAHRGGCGGSILAQRETLHVRTRFSLICFWVGYSADGRIAVKEEIEMIS
jgi:RHS repeat-associated protein